LRRDIYRLLIFLFLISLLFTVYSASLSGSDCPAPFALVLLSNTFIPEPILKRIPRPLVRCSWCCDVRSRLWLEISGHGV